MKTSINNANSDKGPVWEKIDKILYYDWDPIGVKGFGEDIVNHPARDEYYSYISEINQLLNKQVSREEIAKHLNNIRVKRMGSPPNYERDLQIADLLLAIKLNEMTIEDHFRKVNEEGLGLPIFSINALSTYIFGFLILMANLASISLILSIRDKFSLIMIITIILFVILSDVLYIRSIIAQIKSVKK